MRRERKVWIMQADDDRLDRELFSDALASSGTDYKLDQFESGIELLKSLHAGNRPDLIFLDLNMPIKDGRETLQEIKSNTILKSLPVYIFSTSNAHFDIEQSYEAGANLFLSKPDDFTSLTKLLSDILNISKGYASFPFSSQR